MIKTLCDGERLVMLASYTNITLDKMYYIMYGRIFTWDWKDQIEELQMSSMEEKKEIPAESPTFSYRGFVQ